MLSNDYVTPNKGYFYNRILNVSTFYINDSK